MKSRLALVLSITGVLVAGSAAAYVNTQVLASGDGTASAEETPDAPAAMTTVPGAVVATLPHETVPTATLPTETVAPVGGVVPSAAPVGEAAVATQATYAIGTAGTVTLDRAGGQLRIVSAVPAIGWTVTEAENQGPLSIEVTLQSSTTKVEFRANLLYDVVSTSVESTDLTAPAPVTGGSTGGSTGYSDDDDHDDEGEYENDDHEDDDHEDESDDHEEEGDDD